MRTFRLIGMALIAVVMCVNFTSCSDDDEGGGDNNGQPSGKLLREIIYNSYGYMYQFAYNQKRQLVSVYEKYLDSNDINEEIHFEWSDSEIHMKCIEYHWDGTGQQHTSEYKEGFLLENNIITSIFDYYDGEFTYLSYDPSKHLIEEEDEDYRTVVWTWENDNISKMAHFDTDGRITGEFTYTYYTDKEKKHPNIFDFGDFEFPGNHCLHVLLKAHPNFLGNGNKNLLKSVHAITYEYYPAGGIYPDGYINRDESVTDYEYEFDNEGYPIKIIETYHEGSYTSDHFYTLVWQ